MVMCTTQEITGTVRRIYYKQKFDCRTIYTFDELEYILTFYDGWGLSVLLGLLYLDISLAHSVEC